MQCLGAREYRNCEEESIQPAHIAEGRVRQPSAQAQGRGRVWSTARGMRERRREDRERRRGSRLERSPEVSEWDDD